jgi:type IV pilus assembly protein PilM
MSLWRKLKQLAQDPAPAHVFELSEAGLAYSVQGQQGFVSFPPQTLVASLVEDNLLGAETAVATLERIAPPGGGKKRRPAAVILPDSAVRVSLLDFDSFPSSAEEQAALVRFRVKKTVPFDIESAAVGYWVQPGGGNKKTSDVIAVTVALEILARYEALFRSTGFHPGDITPSTLAALELVRESGIVVLAKLAGHTLTVAALADGRLKLFRCLSLEEATGEEILGVLQPTFAYLEDELGQPPAKLLTCGFSRPPDGLTIAAEPLRSRLGEVNGCNAGLLGYLEAVA